MVAEFEYESSPRSILAAIVADPDLGPPALSHPATLFSVLRDYLPDSPRETGPLLAAAQLDIPRALRGQVARGVPRPMAIQFAATKLAARTDFSDEACLWAASEFALALGLATADQLPALTPASDLTAVSPAEPGLADDAGSRLPPSEPPGFRPERPRRRRGWLAAIIARGAAAAAAAGGGGRPRPPPAPPRPRPRRPPRAGAGGGGGAAPPPARVPASAPAPAPVRRRP